MWNAVAGENKLQRASLVQCSKLQIVTFTLRMEMPWGSVLLDVCMSLWLGNLIRNGWSPLELFSLNGWMYGWRTDRRTSEEHVPWSQQNWLWCVLLLFTDPLIFIPPPVFYFLFFVHMQTGIQGGWSAAPFIAGGGVCEFISRRRRIVRVVFWNSHRDRES